MSSPSFKMVLWAGFAVLMQLLIFRHLRYFGAEPDLVLIYLIWIIANKDRTTAIYHAAGMGFLLDAVLDLWGIHMLTKVITVFAAYHFVPKIADTKLLLSQVFFVILLVSFFHNLILTGMATFAQSRVDLIFWNILIGNTFFSSFVGSFIYIFKSK